MSYLSWNHDFSVGVKAFDAQHQKLIGIINSLQECMMGNRTGEMVERIIDELVTYTEVHFHAEEHMMVEYRFPAYKKHKAQHDDFAEKVLAFQKEHKAGKTDLPEELLHFLKDWLSTHILGFDKEYGAYFNEKGVT